MKRLIKSIIFFTLLFSCKNENDKGHDKLVVFDLTKIQENSDIKLSDLGFVNIEYVPLETNEESVLPGFDETSLILGNYRIIADDSYFLLKQWNLVLRFRIDGSFIGRIGTEGRGPHEYTVAHDIDVNPENHNIYIVSAWQKKFNVYSAKGEFIRSFQMPIFAPIEFRFVDGNILCYTNNLQGNIENSFVLLDTTGTILKNFPNKYPFTKHKSGVAHEVNENLFYRFNNQLFKKEVYSDTVYVYKNMNFTLHFVIEEGERLITPKARSEFEGLEIAKKYINPINLFEFGDFVYYSFMYDFILGGDTKVCGFIGSKENGFRSVFNLEKGLINDLDGGPNIVPLTTKDDNTIVAIIDALKLKTHVASVDFKNSNPKYPEKKKELEKLVSSLKETDNPVLVLVKLKK